MQLITDYASIEQLNVLLDVEKAYPFSIVDGYQSGEVFVDDINDPTVALFWHRSGFAFIAGECNRDFLAEIHDMMLNPTPEHCNRMIVQTRDLSLFNDYEDVTRYKRYTFSLKKEAPELVIPEGCELRPITTEVFGKLDAKVRPADYWKDAEEFASKGFGYYLSKGDEILAFAFSAAVSNKRVDIGVDTFEKYREHGYGKVVASAMLRETLNQKKTPVWACIEENEASQSLACSIGFDIFELHPYYKIQK